MLDQIQIIEHTKSWITNVVIDCNFCPFAAREVKRNSILYEVIAEVENINEALQKLFTTLDENENIETAFLILPNDHDDFLKYLDKVEKAEKYLNKNNYEGIYQIASFHPQYLFAGSNENDPSNYTNRSPYPMLHILREESLSKAIDSHPDVDAIPDNNIKYTQEKGLNFMKTLFLKSKMP